MDKQRILRSLSLGLLSLGLVLGLVSCAKSTGDSNKRKTEMASESDNRLSLDSPPDYHQAALINVELGLSYLGQGQVARAKTKLVHAIELAPKAPETHAALGHFLEMIGEFKDSEREYKKAVSLGHNGSAYNNYGTFLCRRARFEEADKAFNRAIEDKGYARTAEVYENAGLCALKWPSDEKAAEYFNIAITRDPQRTSALLALVELDIKNGNILHAGELLDRYKKIAAPSARSVWLSIQVAKKSNNNNTVAKEVLTLKNLFEDSPEYQAYLKSEKAK